jgi:perosamine synthetase
MIKTKMQLIPRYNWDYSFSDYTKAFLATFRSNSVGTASLKTIFGEKPIFTTSGRTSLYAILKSLRIPEGSQVGVPLFCCPVVFDAICQAGLKPKFIDVDLEDYNLCAEDLDRKKDSLSAVLVVHMFGHPADIDSIATVAGKLPIIEDCAQSLFSTYKGKYTGFLSTASFFSFRSGKYVSAGEGSAIFTRNPYLHSEIEDFVDTFDKFGTLEETIHCTATYIKSTLYNRPWYGLIGYPVGMLVDRKLNVTAKTGFKLMKIAKSDLKIIDERLQTFFDKIRMQRENALYLLKNLRMANVTLPREKTDCWSNYYQFAIRFESREERNRMAEYLFSKGIDTAQYLDDVIHAAKDNHHYSGDCPTAEYCSQTINIIPNHYTLSQIDMDRITDCLNDGNVVLK